MTPKITTSQENGNRDGGGLVRNPMSATSAASPKFQTSSAHK